jgi:hypothetical protein
MYSLNGKDINESYKNKSNKMIIIVSISYLILSAFILLSYFDKNSKLNRKYDTIMKYKGKIPNEYKRIVVYSCLIGNYDNVSSFIRQNGYDYILFTDRNIINTNWTVLPIPKEVKKLEVSDIKKQRYIKIHPHKFFKNYDLSLYIDANYIIKGDLNDFFINTLNPLDIIYIPHLQFGSDINKSIHDAIENKLDNISVLNETLKRYEQLKILNKLGIVNAGLIIRKHHEKDCIKLMDKWWEEIENYSHIDSFTFNYAGYMTGVQFLYISYQFTLDYFGHNDHLKKVDY